MSLLKKVADSILNITPNSFQSRLPAHNLSEWPPYQYIALSTPRSIRLLEIHAAAQEDIISCNLHVVDIDSNPVYDALSYTWGDPRPPIFYWVAPQQWQRKFPILCDGAVIQVTANLYHALLKLRSLIGSHGDGSGQARRVWIDALCINQADIPERSAQVSMMEDIYSNAQLVVVWLGVEDRYTAPALRVINYLSQIPKSEYPRHKGQHLGKLGIPQEDCEALVAFFRRSWFHRVWVVQEIVLAPQVVVLLGQCQVPWEVLVKCSNFMLDTEAARHLLVEVSRLSRLEDHLAKPTLKLIGAEASALERYKTQLKSGDMPVWSLLMYGRLYKATDPRDHVYAMLGLVKRLHQVLNDRQIAALVPIPDYSKSVAEVFTDAAAFILDISQNLILLSLVGDRYSRSPEHITTPSWVPDLTVPSATFSLLQLSMGPDNKSNWAPCLGESDATGTGVVMDGRILCIRGAYFDTISTVSMFLGRGINNYDWIGFLELMRPYWMSVLSGTAFADALWRTLIADTDMETRQSPADPSHGSAFAEWLVSRVVPLQASGSGSGLGLPTPAPGQQNIINPEMRKPTSATRILMRGLWDQFSQDPSSFMPLPTEPGSQNATHARPFQSQSPRPDHLREVDNRRQRSSTTDRQHPPQKGYDLLLELSSLDTTGIFPNKQQLDQLLQTLNGPDSDVKSSILSRVITYMSSMKYIGSG